MAHVHLYGALVLWTDRTGIGLFQGFDLALYSISSIYGCIGRILHAEKINGSKLGFSC